LIRRVALNAAFEANRPLDAKPLTYNRGEQDSGVMMDMERAFKNNRTGHRPAMTRPAL
jgi:hypothetical protein